jgi:manganese/zinc/iron transport system substrate-binding protein
VAEVIARRGVKAVFVESSVPRQTIQAVIAAAERLGQPVRLGGELFSDAAGDEGTPEGTYPGMVVHNAWLIAAGLR